MSSSIMFAQTSKKKYRTWSVGVNFGALIGYTDIKQYDYAPVTKFENELKWGGGISVTKAISPVLSLREDFTIGSLAGTKRHSILKPDIQTSVYDWVYYKTNFFDISTR